MGGDHKCPLCSATFTRPQHVGRHLRAHTGDRPYECKECPLRFARSDLLSRHVNKAHKPPDENAPQDKKTTKKGRRKSFPASATSKQTVNENDNNGEQSTPQGQAQQPIGSQQREKPRSASFNQQPQLQAQRMYPHHPLLGGSAATITDQNSYQTQPQAQTWSNNPSQAYATTAGMTNFSSSPYSQTFVNPSAAATTTTGTGNPNAILGNPSYTNMNVNVPMFDTPFTAAPMRMTGSEQGYSSIGQVPVNNNNGVLYEWGFKKRACDQCNHSKVRCDFADPCLRCAHRNIKCSYNKPQRSRTIGYPLVPSQSTASPKMTTGVSPQTSNPISTSPQSQFSSPHSNSSPIAPTQPLTYQAPRHNSVSSYPAHVSVPSANVPLRQWGSYSHIPGAQPHLSTNSWQPIQSDLGQGPYSHVPAGTAPGSITGQIQQSPAAINTSLQSMPSYHTSAQTQGQGQAQNDSPQQGFAPTPSLTNNTISPPDIDEPFERRSSYTGTTDHVLPGQEWQDQSKSYKTSNTAPTLRTYDSDPTFVVPADSSPLHISPTQPQTLFNDSPFVGGYNMQWPASTATATGMEQSWQSRRDMTSDEDNASALSSSTNSAFLELNDAQFNPLQQHQRRRSSAGQWASALAQMSIQDPSGSTEQSIIPLPEPFANTHNIGVDLNSASQQGSSRRPTFPTLTGVTEEPDLESQPMPSLSDVKDLWRLFMTEPMAGLTPLGEKHNDLELNTNSGIPNGPLITPRPGLGKRSLSKSNSMPDLQSPIINGPTFFNTFLNGITPKPTDPQNSYIPNQQPAAGGHSSANDSGDMRKWNKEIQQRQSSFSLQGQPYKIGGNKSNSQQFAGGYQNAINSMAPPSMNIHPQAQSNENVNANANRDTNQRMRPLPSVVQRSSALEQTLAPERIPSFGVPQALYDNQSPASTSLTSAYNQNHYSTIPPAPAPSISKSKLSGVPPHMARPGNKRLASQTLMGDNEKKATFALYDEDDSSTDINIIPSQPYSHKQTQQPQPQPQLQSQSQNQSQANSMFYPNWSLNPQNQLHTQPPVDVRRG
ncbi:uncharacterized protein IL334_001031 [Kwoniella shivajii]|uniref:Zn(2)-C6 fungal-type domain-containing protein n=1 Tax=Kwoniella shivajii TaxID=564305 RepID=A0ABZ1CQT8_9TREE|nr:hypothetical protein IL334_001031 [Kwoniella shivajii]